MEITKGIIGSTPAVLNRVKIAITDRKEAAVAARAKAEGPSVSERQQELIHFYTEYETLVETICDAAQYGPTPFLEKSYGLQREWMLANYPNIRRYALAYLRYEIEDAGDPFEALFQPENLAKFLQSDDGNMISRIMRTREALNFYGDHLRQLAAAA